MFYILDTNIFLDYSYDLLAIDRLGRIIESRYRDHVIIIFDFIEHEWMSVWLHKDVFSSSDYRKRVIAFESVLQRLTEVLTKCNVSIKIFNTKDFFQDISSWKECNLLFLDRGYVTALGHKLNWRKGRLLGGFDALLLACILYYAKPGRAFQSIGNIKLVTDDHNLELFASNHAINSANIL